MSPHAPLTVEQLRSAIAPSGINDQIEGVATMASVGLALLTYFIDRQAGTLATLVRDLAAYTKKQIAGQLVRDLILGLLTAVGVIALAPLIEPLFDQLSPFHRSAALRLLFLIVVAGYVALATFQASVIYRRGKRLSEKT